VSEDPFIFEGDTVLENGNSKSGDLPPVKKQAGFQKFTGTKSWDENLREFLESGDPEKSAGKKRKPKVSHHKRAVAYLEGLGYQVAKVERWVTLPSGFAFKCDFLGLFDYMCTKKGQTLYVQLCGGEKDQKAHLRNMCSDKPAPDNRKPRIVNLRNTLDSGAWVALLGFEKQENGRYLPVPKKITPRDVEECLARKRKKAA